MVVLIAPDKFKGTLNAAEAARAIAVGWQEHRPSDVLEIFPITDGGDGFGELLGKHLNAETRLSETMNAAHEPITAPWWWVAKSKLAIVESAKVIGLALLPRGKYHPFELDTLGLATVLGEVAKLRPKKCLVGIGGSATNDAGFGLAIGLGWRFFGRRRELLNSWTSLHALQRFEKPRTKLGLGKVIVAVDVRNPLLGPRGATRVYGPQKGIRPQDIEPAEKCLRRLVYVLAQRSLRYKMLASAPGSGAAGGLGFGLSAFVGATLESGFEIFSRLTKFVAHMRRADLVITGEGSIDVTTLAMGKGVGRVAALARRLGRPCIALAGVVSVPQSTRTPFRRLFGIVPGFASQEEAMANPQYWLTRLAAEAARTWAAEEPIRLKHASRRGLSE